jgi:ABC-type transporter Mla subunit MlaD
VCTHAYGARSGSVQDIPRDAGGLDADTSVLFGGIKVGQVTRVGPDTDDPTRIEIAFEVKAGTPVNGQSKAQVGTVSPMGTLSL